MDEWMGRVAEAFINKDLAETILGNMVWEIYGNGYLSFVLLAV